MPTLSRESNLYFDDLPTHISIFNSTQPHRKCIKRVAATHFCTITSTSIISKVSMKAQTLLFWSISKTDATFQDYCSSCRKLLEQGKSCTECQTTKSAKFIAVPIESQIESKLQGQFTIVVLTVTMGNMHVEILSRGVCYWCELHCLRVLVSCKHL